MSARASPLQDVFKGWDDYQASLVRSIVPLNPEQLAFCPRAGLRSPGEIAYHISEGRLTWFARMGAPGSAELSAQAAAVRDRDRLKTVAPDLVRWLEATWTMVARTLSLWTAVDLEVTYRHPYQGKVYAVSRQWTLWRILAHDLHHGGELSVTLGLQGIAVPELGDLGGHLTYPPLAEP